MAEIQNKKDHHRAWLETLPESVAEMLASTEDTFSDFAGHVKMAQALAKVAFKRAVDGALNPWANPKTEEGLEIAPTANQEESANERLNLAIRANESASKLMEQRLAMQDKYKLVERVPLPMAIRINVVQVAKEEQDRRLALARPDRVKIAQAQTQTQGETVEP